MFPSQKEIRAEAYLLQDFPIVMKNYLIYLGF